METSDGYPTAIVVAFTCFYFLVFLSSIVGNSFVLSLCCKDFKQRPSSHKYFIANLAAADLTFTTLTILDLISFLWQWVGGQMSCKLESFLVEACYTTSIMTLALISYERLKAVVQPFNARLIAPAGVHRQITAVWVISFLVALPLLYENRVEKDSNGAIACNNRVLGDLGRQLYYSIHAVCFFLVPLIYMIYAQVTIFLTLRAGVVSTQNAASATTCSNRRMHRKVAKTLAALTLAFVTCWSPFTVVRALKYFHELTDEGYIWRLLILLNTALDPILYGIYGRNLKPFLGRLFRCTTFTPSTRRAGNVNMKRPLRLRELR